MRKESIEFKRLQLPTSHSGAISPDEKPASSLEEISNYHLVIKSTKQASLVALVGILEGLTSILNGLVLARVSQQALAASSLIGVTQSVFLSPTLAALGSIAIKIRNELGAGTDDFIVGKIGQRGIMLSTSMDVIAALLIRFAAAPILSVWGQDQELVAISQTFFSAFAWCVVPLGWIRVARQISHGVNRQLLVVVLRTLTLGVLGYSVYALTLSKNDDVESQVAGLGYAYSISGLAGISFWLIVLASKYFKQYQIFRCQSDHSKILKQLWSVGWPLALRISVDYFGSYFSTMFIGIIGKSELAAQQISLGLSFIIVQATLGIQQSASYLVSHYLGKDNLVILKKIGIINYLTSLIFPVFSILIFAVAYQPLASIYINTSDPENQPVLNILKILLPLKATLLAVSAIESTSYGLLSGLKDTLIPTLYSIIGIFFVGLSTSALFSFGFGWGIYGVILGQEFGTIVNAFTLTTRWVRISNNEEKIREMKKAKTEFSCSCLKRFYKHNDSKETDALVENSIPKSDDIKVNKENGWNFCPNLFKNRRGITTTPSQQPKTLTIGSS